MGAHLNSVGWAYAPLPSSTATAAKNLHFGKAKSLNVW